MRYPRLSGTRPGDLQGTGHEISNMCQRQQRTLRTTLRGHLVH